MKHLLFLFTLILSTQAFSQNNALTFGEDLTFSASYNMSGVLTEVAQVKMETSKLNTNSGELMRLKVTATTYSSFDSYFKIRDLYESYVNPKTIKPYLYNREIDEGGHYKFVKYNFDYSSRTVKALLRKKSKNFESGFWDQNFNNSFSNNTRDIISTLYYLRTLDIKKAPIGASDTFIVLFDNKEVKCSFKLLAKETINTALGSKLCYKLAINVSGTSIFKGNNDNLIWLTADENKIPVYAKFKIAVGNGELKIKSANGLKN
ncbi:DUF3108 domain-containing protein [Aurantibacter aestuarii]|uniref:DUF3108 domain-containing protein n=1 Tax=Aurantibacter aestuarii TaxID=1266046 RepID=A0A2T1N4X7_9FLAO|nr:DUF3108 domain-containing protein [Aurantibacter aestuarii]PSG86338.1 DUF3108 domain-containing protein [Aurantibacter aestuarii]